MKKATCILLVISFAVIYLVGCSPANPFADLSKTTGIEIRIHSPTDNSYTDHVVTDTDTVRSLCDTFSSLKTEKVSVTEPTTLLYELRFYTGEHRTAVASASIVFPGDVIYVGGELYRIAGDTDLPERIADAVSADTES